MMEKKSFILMTTFLLFLVSCKVTTTTTTQVDTTIDTKKEVRIDSIVESKDSIVTKTNVDTATYKYDNYVEYTPKANGGYIIHSWGNSANTSFNKQEDKVSSSFALIDKHEAVELEEHKEIKEKKVVKAEGGTNWLSDSLQTITTVAGLLLLGLIVIKLRKWLS